MKSLSQQISFYGEQSSAMVQEFGFSRLYFSTAVKKLNSLFLLMGNKE